MGMGWVKVRNGFQKRDRSKATYKTKSPIEIKVMMAQPLFFESKKVDFNKQTLEDRVTADRDGLLRPSFAFLFLFLNMGSFSLLLASEWKSFGKNMKTKLPFKVNFWLHLI